ncbi:MAG: T9SS type A sorting domain-containing protein [Bacteroidales bacterium]|nr:T9SS type A sorting domain-containing protein [Bacteroidales bacterium]
MKSHLKNTEKRRSFRFKSVLMTMFVLVWAMNAQAQTVQWKNNFGGSGRDDYNAVATLPDGIVAVGGSMYTSFGNGDWEGIPSKGGTDYDAIIVKYDNAGNVVWKKNFGGKSQDVFDGVTIVPDGIVAVGCSWHDSFGNGDWVGVPSKLGVGDAIIVKYDYDGNVLWKKNFGGMAWDEFYGVTTVSDGVVAVGLSQKESFNSAGDWADENSNVGYADAIIVKYNNNGDVVWKKHFGGFGDGGTYVSGGDFYNAVTAVSDGIVAVGYSRGDCFGTGDWFGVAGKGDDDAIIVKYDNNGNVMWKKNFGGSSIEEYYAVTAVTDGIVAAGYSVQDSFGNGDWIGVTGKGGNDAIIVKYDNDGNVLWKKNFGGGFGETLSTRSEDMFIGLSTVPDGIVAAGHSAILPEGGTGDWEGVAGNGGIDAIIVKYDNDGNVLWKKHFGGSGTVEGYFGNDYYNAVTVVSDGIVAVGESPNSSFGTGDWTGVTGKGGIDATIVKYLTGSSISGYVGESGGGKSISSKSGGNPVEGVDVLLQKKTSEWNTISATVSNKEGYFEFLSIPVGTYRVILDIPGLQMLSYRTIEITEDGTIIDDLEFEITEDGIITIGGDVSITDINGGNGIAVYPNPTSGLITICDVRCATCDIAIFDVMGRAVVVAPVETRHATSLQSPIENRPSQITFDVSNLPAGVYFIRITTENGIVTREIVKKY